MAEREHYPRPTELNLNQRRRVLRISFDDGSSFDLSCEYLRVFSPSAEVRGHGTPDDMSTWAFPVGKENVNILHIEPVGNYAVRLHFDDGHHTGIYPWQELYDLALNQDTYWQRYLDHLERVGYQRQSPDAG